jgi:hypothetical protein
VEILWRKCGKPEIERVFLSFPMCTTLWKTCGKAVDTPVDEMWKTAEASAAVDNLAIRPQAVHRPSTGRYGLPAAERHVIHSFHSTDYYDDSYIYREFISNSAVNNQASARRGASLEIPS